MTCPESCAKFDIVTPLPILQLCAMWTYASNRQSSPTLVVSPFPLARWMLTYSRITVRSPIVVYETSSSDLRSRDGAPIEANGWIVTSLPIVVCPLTTTCASRRERAPMRTCSPITQNGPISLPGPMTALGWTIAKGWIETLRLSRTTLFMQDRCVESERTRIFDDREHQLRRTDELPVDGRVRLDPADILPAAQHADFHHQLVARDDRLAELGLVDPGEVRNLALPIAGLEDDRAPQLRHRLDHVDPREERVPREVTAEDRLVRRDVLVTDGPRHRLEFEDPVDENERIAMRQDIHDPPDVDGRLRHRAALAPGRTSPHSSRTAR